MGHTRAAKTIKLPVHNPCVFLHFLSSLLTHLPRQSNCSSSQEPQVELLDSAVSLFGTCGVRTCGNFENAADFDC